MIGRVKQHPDGVPFIPITPNKNVRSVGLSHSSAPASKRHFLLNLRMDVHVKQMDRILLSTWSMMGLSCLRVSLTFLKDT